MIGVSIFNLARAFVGAAGSGNSFGHHVHRPRDLIKRFALAEPFSDGVIAAVLAVAGHDQDRRRRSIHKRFGRLRPWRAEPDHFGQRSRDQRGFGIVAQAEAIADSGSDCEHILQRAAELDDVTSWLV